MIKLNVKHWLYSSAQTRPTHTGILVSLFSLYANYGQKISLNAKVLGERMYRITSADTSSSTGREKFAYLTDCPSAINISFSRDLFEQHSSCLVMGVFNPYQPGVLFMGHRQTD